MRRLEGKVAWISGAASGIGEATSRLFAAEGAKVALVGKQFQRIQQIRADLNAAGAETVAVACDVSREQQVRASIRRTVTALGGIDIIVNNAGIVQVKPLHESTEKAWNEIMAVNVKAVFFAVKHALPHLRRAGRSWIVNVGSISSFVGQA